MSNQQTPQHGYWRSLAEVEVAQPSETSQEELYDDMAREAASGTTSQDLVSRRNFFQLMGASMALAGVAGAGCKRYEKDHIAPLPRRPEDQVPGETQQYSTMMELGGAAQALVATSFEGRPIKVDGNPDHPFANGSTGYAQASVLHLYDPDRSQNVLQGGKTTTFEAFEVWLDGVRGQLGTESGSVAVLSEATSSPTVARMRAALQAKLPQMAWHEWEPLSWDNERAGTRQAFGRPLRQLVRLENAHTILTLDCDLFVEHPASLRYGRDFGQSRRPSGSLGGNKMNRLWTVESVFTSTGAMADHRLPLRAELVLPLAMALDASLNGGAAPSSEFLREPKIAKFLTVLVEEMQQSGQHAVVVAGRRQPPEVHALVARINDKLGSIGTTLNYIEDPDPSRPSHLESITELAKKMAQGAVKTLFILGGNPVYDAPWDLKFDEALSKVATSVHLAEYANETSAKTTWHLPRAHYLEAWGDARTWDGTLTVAQPLIAPLYGGITPAELLSLISGGDSTGQALVRATHLEAGITSNWEKMVHDGFVANAATPLVQPALVAFAAPALSPSQLTGTRRKNGELEVVFASSTQTYDGRYANNAWLQETPDFLTKVTWDNYALVSPATATDLGLKNDTIIQVKVGERAVDVACYVMPGQARYSIGLVLGGGRTRAGKVGGDGKKQVGFDTYKVRGTNGFDIAVACSVSPGTKEYVLANVQEHWDIRTSFPGGAFKNIAQDGIAQRLPSIVRETTPDKAADPKWKAQPTLPYHMERERGLSLFEEHQYKGHRWAMSIDLSNCLGCNACIISCQAENNIPVVGKDQVIRNREMSWLRIDRYFKGSPDEPEIAFQPLACVQCENAPCEQVCPVGATTHSDEGLNDMAYNRCVGTRYCLNNCPYRVRRFNFLDYHKEFSEARNRVRKLLFNPDVTVRSRGVMEKCTYCVQRIQNGKIKHKALVRSGQLAAETLPSSSEDHIEYKIPDGTIVTACQSACPTDAIVFGDLADPQSKISQLHEDKRSYDLLDELYTKPRTRYMARIRNPNPKLVAEAPAHEGGH